MQGADTQNFWVSACQISDRRLKLKPIIAAKAKERQIESGGAVLQKSAKLVDTKKTWKCV